jgi:hypothetical protein
MVPILFEVRTVAALISANMDHLLRKRDSDQAHPVRPAVEPDASPDRVYRAWSRASVPGSWYRRIQAA